MNKVSRPLVIVLLAVLVFAIIGAILASSSFHADGPTLMLFDEDLSDSALGWMIAIPILIVVGVIVATVMAGVALITTVALAFAAVMVVLAVMLAFAPLVILMAIPALAIYGIIKLIQRDQRKVTTIA